ncbi:hypothetical protein [Siccirubricoccus sp. G192]|uniref:hypothetical protein n=1 Tax=Siccirubricoccus sp. G192 TaxID=2849651 RepID=UPI001C2B99CC|nr:hypothetical protein [Siccirubricoccus sp. G192]MBV1795859.1 hypothetical protein [Siccirubricoccus sp. G192]
MACQLALPGILLRLSQAPAARRGTGRLAWRATAKALLRGLRTPTPGERYQPELHYMRGGRTHGCRSLARG